MHQLAEVHAVQAAGALRVVQRHERVARERGRLGGLELDVEQAHAVGRRGALDAHARLSPGGGRGERAERVVERARAENRARRNEQAALGGILLAEARGGRLRRHRLEPVPDARELAPARAQAEGQGPERKADAARPAPGRAAQLAERVRARPRDLRA